MRGNGKRSILLFFVLAAMLFVLCFSGCAAAPDGEDETAGGLERFENAKLGVVTGSLYGGYSREQFPNAEIMEYNTFADVLLALKLGKVDGAMLDMPNFNAVKRTEKHLEYTPVPAYSVEIGFGFQMTTGGTKLQSEMNGFLATLRSSGKLDELLDKWYGETEPEGDINLPFASLTGTPLRVSIDTTRKPFVYNYNNGPVGFEMEVLYLFCKEMGYSTGNFEVVPFATGIGGLATNKYDVVCGGLYMTPARKEEVNFSDPYMKAEVVMATYNGSVNFFDSIGESFQKTFVREGRWKLILEGMGTTLLISVSAVLGGTVLGFLIYLAANSKYKWLSAAVRVFAKVYSTIISGLPMLVILMVLFYVVFGTADISGTAVAIIGFILTFGSFVYNRLTLAVGGVDIGQTEAAYALGYGKNRTFFKIVLPQAMKTFAPVWSAEIVSTVKATSIVGYIAVSDLTKVGDIIRSNTYEVFFPLIAVALIYFLLTWGITALLGFAVRRLDPSNKNARKRNKKSPQKEAQT